MLRKDGAVTFHVRSIRKVAVEMFKVYHGIAPEVMCDLFSISESSTTRTGRKFVRKENKTVFFGKMSLSSFGPIVWNEMLPESLKQCESLLIFKSKIKNWDPQCKCRLCRNYVHSVGFV